MTDEEICKTIIDSGLRGRGGGGFPAGRKWDGARQHQGRPEVRGLQRRRGRPRRLYGPLRAWRATPTACWRACSSPAAPSGASEGYIYVRAEYPLAVNRLKTAIARRRGAGPSGREHLRHRLLLPTSMSTRAQAPSSAARAAPSPLPSRATGACPALKPPVTVEQGLLGRSPRSSTTWRPSPTCP